MGFAERKRVGREILCAAGTAAFHIDEGQPLRGLRAEIEIEAGGVIIHGSPGRRKQGAEHALVRARTGPEKDGDVRELLIERARKKKIIRAVESHGHAVRRAQQAGT
jgi:hypothetical protein